MFFTFQAGKGGRCEEIRGTYQKKKDLHIKE
jgi:hypothetical protein